jgi:RNA polymerase sigma factor (sigma-70 family)
MNIHDVADETGLFQARNSSEGDRLDQSLANLVPGLLAAEQEWVEFVEQARNLVFRVSDLRGLTATEAADVFQEVMLAVVGRLGKPSNENVPASGEAWVRRIASNKTADVFRGRERAERLDVRSMDWNQPADEEREELQWRTEVLPIALRNVRDRVSQQDFKIFEMALLDGLRAIEIAGALQKTVEAVYSAIKRVRREVCDEIRHLREIGY